MARADASEGQAARLIAGGAAVLATSVLADSAVEHYRGSFHNPAMVAPLAASIAAIAVNGAQGAGARGVLPVHVAAIATGTLGLGFHFYDIVSRPGGWRLVNLFYAAPVGAPAALVLAGTLGGAAQALGRGEPYLGGRGIAAIAAVGIAGSVAEAGLLHFRGAFHNPAMWLPVSLPPLAAVSLVLDVASGRPSTRTAILLGLTAALGFLGSAFHVYGVSRNMGGWRNWRQNLLAGPPIPAPPAFTGLALAGLGALLLMRRRTHG